MKNIILLFSSLPLNIAAMAYRPVLGIPMNRTDWNNDIPGFVSGKFYFSGGIGSVNLNYTMVNALKKSIAPNWKNISVEKRNTWFVKGEYAITPHLGIGANFAFSGLDMNVSMDSVTKFNVPITGALKYRSWSALARVNYHIIAENNFDLYVGAGIGFRSNKFSVETNDPITDRWNFPIDLGFITKRIPNSLNIPTVGSDFTVGMRYHILPPIALYAEFGVAKTFLQAGVTIRI